MQKVGNMNVDFNKIRAGVLLPTAIGFVVIFLGFMVNLMLGLLNYIPIIGTILDFMVGLGNLVLSVLGFIIFLFLYMWAGYRTARKYRGDLNEAGIAGALSYTLLAVINLMFDTINAILKIFGIVTATAIGGISGSAYEDFAIALLGGSIVGTTGIIAVLCCGIARIPIGILLNYFVGSIGGMLGSSASKS